jgi:magnesium chelatase subunit D
MMTSPLAIPAANTQPERIAPDEPRDLPGGQSIWSDWATPLQVAALAALDPVGLGGIALRASAGPARDALMGALKPLLPGAPWVRIPLNVAEARLLGGLDLSASLVAGRPIAEQGLLARADGGVVILAMAERLSSGTVAKLCAVLDSAWVVAERDGLSLREAARFGVIAFDEGEGDDEALAPALVDRLAFQLDLNGLRLPGPLEFPISVEEIVAARHLLERVTIDDATLAALTATALALGVGSLRPTLFAIRAARALAALDGAESVDEEHARRAAELVLAPRATRSPAAEDSRSDEGQEDPEPGEKPEPPANEDGPDPPDPADEPEPSSTEPLEDVILAAARAAIPKGLLLQLGQGLKLRSQRSSVGRAGAQKASKLRGRPAGVRAGMPGAGARLNLVETLRAAAPWQKLRRAERLRDAGAEAPAKPARESKVLVRVEDFRIARYVQRAQTTTLFVIDASGSSALHRLAEAKGAVELLLADCYVRRDRVAVLSFRGSGVELLLPPTRSLVRAKRCLSGLPGGGGTPLAAAIDAAFALADGLRRRGETPTIVFLTDGRGNIARDGSPGRDRAAADALVAARRLRHAQFSALLVDTSARAAPTAEELASSMGARYLWLPYANAASLSAAVQSVFQQSGGTPKRA